MLASWRIMRRILIYISVFVFVAIIAVRFYYLNLARYTESSKHALKLSMILLSEKLSYDYFQWTEFYKAVQKDGNYLKKPNACSYTNLITLNFKITASAIYHR